MRVAIVGTGNIAARHAEALTAQEDVELVAHLGTSRAKATVAAERFGGTPFDDLATLIAEARPDAAILTVPPHAHGPLEEALLDAGVHLLVEKPLDVDGSVARGLAQRIAAGDQVVAVAYHFRALDLLDHLRPVLAERPPLMVHGAWLTSMPPVAWWQQRASGGGQLVEQATHLVDLARALCGEGEPLAAAVVDERTRRFPDADVATASAALVRFERGAIGTFAATCALGAPHTAHLQVVFDGGIATLDQQRMELVVDGERSVHEVEADPFATEQAAFFRAIRTGRPELVLCDYADALRTHELCLAFEGVAAASPAPVLR